MVVSFLLAQSLLSGLGSLGAPEGVPRTKSFLSPLEILGEAPGLQDGSRKLWECRVNSDQKSPADKARLSAPCTLQMASAILSKS